MGSPTFSVVVAALLFALRCVGDSDKSTTSGTAFTSRYWGCCKPSCGWKGKADFNQPVRACDAKGNALTDFTAGSGCYGGTAFACSDQTPWAVNDTFSYGFAGAHIAGGSESTWCCACYKLEFISGNITGKTMIIQASDTDYDMPSDNLFTFGIPGSNNSYEFCDVQYGVQRSIFGDNVTGVATRADCENLPSPQRDACTWRFDWFQDAFQPSVNYTRVACPQELTNITGCIRDDEKSLFGSAAAPSAASSSAMVSAYVLGIFSVLAVLVPPLFL